MKQRQLKRIFICASTLAGIFAANGQLPVKFDSHYKTIFAKDLCKLAATNQNVVLIDVRSPGEYSDTSQYNYLNIGHLKSAINIPIDSIQKNLAVLDPYKNKTMVFYCSHSQRSRRVSYLLSQNGYKDFYNLNGGMSHINQMTREEFPCKNDLLESNLTYRPVSSTDAIQLIQKDPSVVIIDVRPSSMFLSRDTMLYYNVGRLKKAINIPYRDLTNRLGEIEKYKNQPVLIYANTGNNEPGRFANELHARGFRNVLVMIGGYDDLLVRENAQAMLEDIPSYRILNASSTLQLLKTNPSVSIFDTRPKMEFENKMPQQEFYKNLGNLKNAVNLEGKDFASYSFPKDKNAPILIYGRDEAYKLAQKLSAAGYKNVNVLRNLYDFISSAFNVEGNQEALSYMTNHEGLY